jgi:hypothetical protein
MKNSFQMKNLGNLVKVLCEVEVSRLSPVGRRWDGRKWHLAAPHVLAGFIGTNPS